MHRLIDPEIMRSCEAAYFRASGAASIDVMEVAARALADVALERFPDARRVFIACGPGGNGGDGYACARMLRDAGRDVRIYPAAPAKSADAIANAARVRELIRDAGTDGSRTPADSGVDCEPRTPNDFPSGIRAPSSADAQPAVAEANHPQLGAASPAHSTANDGIQISDSASAKIQPSDTNAKPAISNAPQPHVPVEACLASGHAALGGPVVPVEIPDLWIDCLYGTGLSRAPSGVAAELISRMNRDRAAGAKVLAADIPSGLNGATGARFEPCVEADCTVAFQFAKPGHLIGDGLDVCGELRIADVGFPDSAFPANLPAQIEPSDLRGMFAPRRRNIHKGSCGHLLIVAGSFGMAGAATLCARAALRSGIGLVSIACPASIVPILQGLVPCAMCVPLPEHDGAISPMAVEPLRAALRGKSAVVIGPGLSRRTAPEVVAAVLESDLPAAIDADALNLIAENPKLKSLLRPHHILTPHPGEAARLLGHPCTNPIADARELATLDTKSAQMEETGKRAAIPANAQSGAVNNQVKSAAIRCCAGPIASAQEKATSGCAKTLACMQEKSVEALNRHSEIPANAPAEAQRKHSEALTNVEGKALGGCAEIPVEAQGKRAEALTGTQGEALGGCAEIPVEARDKCAEALTSASDEALDGCAEIPAEAQGKRAEALERAQGEALGSCAETLADARMNRMDTCEGTRIGVLSPSGPTAVLKGASRVIAGGGEVYVSTSGAPGMARGGSGDVYAGILGALLAEKSNRTPAQSAAAACELHGLAGELAQAKYGPRAMNSADLIEFLPEVFRRWVD